MRTRESPERAPAEVIEIRGRRVALELGVSEEMLRETFIGLQDKLINFLALRLGSRAEAQDIAQSVFLKVWERSAALTPQNLPGLIFVTARNLATDMVRSRRSRGFEVDMSSAETANICDDAPLADRTLSAKQDLDLVRRLLDELPDKCRRAFISYRFAGQEYHQIASEMGVTESMIRKYVIRAAAHCASRMEQLEGWE